MKWFKTRSYYLFIPSVLFLLIPLYGLGSAIAQSVRDNGAFTFQYYTSLFESERFLTSAGFSLQVSLVSSLLSLIIGLWITRACYPLLEKYTPRLIVWLPMLFPHFVWGYMVILLLSESGVLSQWMQMTGLIGVPADFPVWTRDPYGIGITLTYVWKEVPFVILMLLPVYASIKPEFYDLVQSLGGGAWERFKTVEWPHLLPVVVESFLIIFAFTLSAYEVPALLGTTYPEMLSVLSYDWFYGSVWEDRPLAFAAMSLMSVFLLMITCVAYLYLNRKRWRAMRGRIE
ncbi:ABC transporter permease subunit [Halobacillus litoralis]|uniref:ABC transporter permease n=1 Tax=Halobacillus litoralis TaxID=45668 RepID=UPI001CD59585|nr:ABC transporter permease subunit [Halobacillus litoralis]MCA0972611.1 ABC transporter permease subunit [Halobacillus litoralis]